MTQMRERAAQAKGDSANRRAPRSATQRRPLREQQLHDLAELGRDVSNMLCETSITIKRFESAIGRVPTPTELLRALDEEVRTGIDGFLGATGAKRSPKLAAPVWPVDAFGSKRHVQLLKVAGRYAELKRSAEVTRRTRLMDLAVKLENGTIPVREAIASARKIRGDDAVAAAGLEGALAKKKRGKQSLEARINSIYGILAWDTPVDILPDTHVGRPRGKLKAAVAEAIKISSSRAPVGELARAAFAASDRSLRRALGPAGEIWRVLEPERHR